MRIAIGSDHRGFDSKKQLTAMLRRSGYSVDDLGCHTGDSTDYPDIARALATAVARGEFDAGILLGSDGMGFCMSANKVRGIRASVAHDEFSARLTREQHHCNVLCLATEVDGGRTLAGIVTAFLSVSPLTHGRHARRVEKISDLEEEMGMQLPEAAEPMESRCPSLTHAAPALGHSELQN